MKDQLHCDVSTFNKNDPCYICPLAKQRRLPFISHNHLSSYPFDLVHCDIWGPYHVAAHSGHIYFLTLVDDCTRFTWVFLLKHKSDVSTVIPCFFHMVNSQFNGKIKAFRTDNAKELAFIDFFHQKGILHQFSCVDRPQQNSMVESKHKHLLNVARALYFQSRVPIQLWSECVSTATFLVNRTPSPWLKHKTPPYELLYQNLVDYSSLQVFGCLVFASTLPVHRSKFHPRAQVCVFLGYPPGMKGYKLYDIENKEIFLSKDVVFHEDIFPSHSEVAANTLVNPFPDLVLPTSLLEVPNLIPPAEDSLDSPPAKQLPSQSFSPAPATAPTIVPTRKSTRFSHPPSYLQEFHCNMLSKAEMTPSSNLYSLDKFISYDSLSSSHKHLVLNIYFQFEPQFYHQAVQFPHW